MASTALPGSELAYTEFTSPVNLTHSAEASADTIVSNGAVAYDGSTSIYLEAYIPRLNPNGAFFASLFFFDGSTSFGSAGDWQTSVGMYEGGILIKSKKLTPSNANHTFSLRGTSESGTAVVNAGAGGSGNTQPGWLRQVKA